MALSIMLILLFGVIFIYLVRHLRARKVAAQRLRRSQVNRIIDGRRTTAGDAISAEFAAEASHQASPDNRDQLNFDSTAGEDLDLLESESALQSNSSFNEKEQTVSVFSLLDGKRQATQQVADMTQQNSVVDGMRLVSEPMSCLSACKVNMRSIEAELNRLDALMESVQDDANQMHAHDLQLRRLRSEMQSIRQEQEKTWQATTVIESRLKQAAQGAKEKTVTLPEQHLKEISALDAKLEKRTIKVLELEKRLAECGLVESKSKDKQLIYHDE